MQDEAAVRNPADGHLVKLVVAVGPGGAVVVALLRQGPGAGGVAVLHQGAVAADPDGGEQIRRGVGEAGG